MKRKAKSQFVFFGKIEDFTTQESIKYWQSQTVEARWKATWELTVNAWKLKGRDLNELRLKRDVALFKRG